MVNYPNGRSRAYSTVPKKKKSLTELSVTKKKHLKNQRDGCLREAGNEF